VALIKSISGIRGTIGGKTSENLTPVDVVKFTAAFGTMIKKKTGSTKVVIGRDARPSGEMVSALVVSTLQGLGIDVIDLGLSTTPTVEIAVPLEKAAGGIILTASHNPVQWNALKLLNDKGEFISANDGEAMLKIAENEDFDFAPVGKLGQYTKNDTYLQKHVDMILKLPLVDAEAIRNRGFNVVVDAVNSTGGIAVPLLLKALDVSVKEMYCEPTGHFPHNPEPLPEHLTDICREIKKGKYDMGIVVDPDVDRLAFVSEDGTPFGEEYTLVAVADYVLKATKKKKVNTVSNLSSTGALRDITVGLGGTANGYPRQDGFDIVVASEVMAIFCLAKDLEDLKTRLGNIIVAYTRDRKPVRAADLKAHGPMAVLLKDALSPNLVQTLESTPAFIHGGPFANIAHGCNSVLATTTALKLADYVVTEAGFGADLGGEKFIDIKCRKTGLMPDAVVLVATIRALKMHGGVKKEDLKTENLKALEAGMANLQRHVENVHKFGLVPVISINRFSADTDAEIALVKSACAKLGVEAVMADHWAEGGKGAADVARAVVKVIEGGKGKMKLLYPDEMPLLEKIRTIAKEIYRAKDIAADKPVRDQLAQFEAMGFGKVPVCIAKTQYSFSTNPDAKGAPSDHIVTVREVRLSAGAEFVVAVCGDIMTMPGLPKVPAANSIDIGPDGKIVGLF